MIGRLLGSTEVADGTLFLSVAAVIGFDWAKRGGVGAGGGGGGGGGGSPAGGAPPQTPLWVPALRLSPEGVAIIDSITGMSHPENSVDLLGTSSLRPDTPPNLPSL